MGIQESLVISLGSRGVKMSTSERDTFFPEGQEGMGIARICGQNS